MVTTAVLFQFGLEALTPFCTAVLVITVATHEKPCQSQIDDQETVSRSAIRVSTL